MTQKLSIKDLDFHGKKALVRVDFNVPMDKKLNLTDDSRIRASLPTIQYIIDHGGSVILMSHLGRPKDIMPKFDPALSLAPCAIRLSQLLQKPVQMAPDCIGKVVADRVSQLKPGDVILLENLRFHWGEEHPDEDPTFVKELASLGDVYVNDAFGSAHRAHASTAAIAQYFPDCAAAGFLMEKEIDYLGNVLLRPKRPFYAILGGAKISTKFGVIKALMQKADALLIGGAMTYTFLKAKGVGIGASLYEENFVQAAKDILDQASHSSCQLLLPDDIIITKEIKPGAVYRVVKSHEGIPDGYEGVDIGPETVLRYSDVIQKASTIFWNGPLGVFEIPPFDQGTVAIARALAACSAVKIVGGGDSLAAVEAAGVADRMDHLSTGGGAALEYIEFGKLPGIEALTEAGS
jgi:phosphoglycerate kinase